MKRALILVVVLVALLALASPAFAFNGFRSDYTLTSNCQGCHTTSPGGPVYNDWVETKHAEAGAGGQATRSPEGSSCAGCHTANYNPSKAIPSATATDYLPVPTTATPSPVPTRTTYSFTYPNAPDPTNINSGDHASSELFVGCSSCHYGQSIANANSGQDVNNTAHDVPMSAMANADICGQCHSRYSYTAQTYNITPTPRPTPITMVQPQYAIGFKMLGIPDGAGGWNLAEPLSTNLIVPQPDWVPSPNPTATTAAGLMMYWKDSAGNNTMWQQLGHDGSAAQYPEWLNEGHADALVNLKAAVPNVVIDNGGCLECHSADYRIAEEGDKPTAAEAKYGITCVGCHTTHEKGTVTGAWDEEFDAQLIGDKRDMCVECHNGHLGDDEAVPGDTVHHPMKEMMNGTGGIDVPAGSPSVHKGKCVQCHMAPTSYSRGSQQLGGNHTFTIIEPEVAVEASPMPITTVTASPKVTTTPTPLGNVRVTTNVTIAQDTMPFSACSTCHESGEKPAQTVATATTTPAPAPTEAWTVTTTQNVAGGDKGLYLQETIEDRQATMQSRIDAVTAELVAAAGRMGYPAGTDDADTIADTLTAIAAKAPADRLASDVSFQKAYTNRTYVESEGSLGIHNYAYANAVITKALQQAQAAKTKLAGVTCVPNVTALTYGGSVTLSGVVTGGLQPNLVGGMVKLWRTNAGSSVANVVGTTYLDGDDSDSYEFVVMPSKTATYYVQFVGNETYEAIKSAPTASVTVAWSVTFKASKTKVKKNQTITFSGVVGPSGVVGQSVIIQRKASGNWVTWKTVPVSITGSWSLKVKMTKVGKMTLRAYEAADTTHTEGMSGSKTITTTKP